MIKRTFFLIFSSLQLLIVSCKDSGQSSKNKTSDKLALQIQAEKKKSTLDEDINIKATLMNQSSDTLLINNSFLIGYEEQDDREIYFKIFSSDGKRYDLPEDHQTDILPVPPTQANMQRLAPDESIKNEVQLTSLHHFREPGKYKVVAVYESKTVNNTPGVYQIPAYSDTLEIEIVK